MILKTGNRSIRGVLDHESLGRSAQPYSGLEIHLEQGELQMTKVNSFLHDMHGIGHIILIAIVTVILLVVRY